MAQGNPVKHKKKTKSVLKEYPPDGAARRGQSHESHASPHGDAPDARGARLG